MGKVELQYKKRLTAIIDLELPQDRTLVTRIAWAGERYADLCEGLLTPEVGWFIWGLIVGWTDEDINDTSRRAFLRMAKQLETLLLVDS